MNQLPAQGNFWQKLGNVVKFVFYPPRLYAGEMQDNNVDRLIASSQAIERSRQEFQGELESKRQEFELARLKAEYLRELDAQKFQREENRLREEFQLKLTEYIQECEKARMDKRIQFEQFLAEKRRQSELELQRRNHEFSFFMGFVQTNIARSLEDYRHILSNYPWRLHPTVILEEYNKYTYCSGRIPPLVIISPPEIEYDKFPHPPSGLPKLEKSIEENLRLFLNQHYGKSDPHRPTDLVGGAWDTNKMRSETAVKLLYFLLKSIPVIILDSEIDGDKLNFRIACWDVGLEYTYQPIISSFPYKEFLYEVAKESAQKWATQKQEILAKGLPLEILLTTPQAQENEMNLLVWQQEKTFQEYGLEESLDYRPTKAGVQKLSQYWSILHCLCVSLATDGYYFSRYSQSPQLPHLLLELTQGLTPSETQWLIDITTSYYQSFCQQLEEIGSKQSPDLYLELALGLAVFADKKLGEQQLEKSLEAFFRVRQQEPGTIANVEQVVEVTDRPFVEKVNQCLKLLDLSTQIKLGEAYYKQGLKFYEEKNYQEAVTNFEEAIAQGYKEAEINLSRAQGALEVIVNHEKKRLRQSQNHEKQGDSYFRSEEYEKAIICYEEAIKFGRTIANAKLAEAKIKSQQLKNLDLGNGVILELVKIPAGSFLMGGDPQRGSGLIPAHEINLKGFLLGKYPVTQKQYQQIMGTNPSNWKGDNLPVEQVTWYQAVDFCQKLSAKTGRQVMLPSEAQWEYAARAGSYTKYFFGDSDSQLSEYAWYNTNSGGKTNPVGEKKPNPWGLYDILGNVREWCQDYWDTDYYNLPKDGRARKTKNTSRSRRGGSWYDPASECSCDLRICDDARYYDNSIGLRVLVLLLGDRSRL